MKLLNNTHFNIKSSSETSMLNSTGYRELKNGKRYQMTIERTMNNHGSTEETANRSSSENVKGEVSEFQSLTQETLKEQIRRFIAPLLSS